MSVVEIGPEDEAEVEEFAGKLFMDCLATMELANVQLGIELGLYEALAGRGPTTPRELATATGIVERYAIEWLEQQATAGVLDVDDTTKAVSERGFSLSNARAHVLIDDDSEACMKPAAACVPWVGKALGIMSDEFRAGRGVSFGAFDLHDIQAAFTRPVFRNHLVQNWLPALADVHDRLVAGEPVRIADIGCGEGLAAIAIGEAFPAATVDGYDLDDASIEVARKGATEAGVSDRVTFHLVDAAGDGVEGPYDLVLLIEMLHDMPDPVGVLRTARRAAGESGRVLVVDERAEDSFTVPGTEMERFFYVFSTLHCLSVAMQDGGAATGTVIRADTVRQYATDAGFTDVLVLDVDHPQFRLYALS